MKKSNPFYDMKHGLERITGKIRSMDAKEVNFWRNGIITAIIINMFGIYWFLGQKSLSVVLLVFFLACLAVLLSNSRETRVRDEKPQHYDNIKNIRRKRKKGGKRKRKMEQQQQKEQKEEEYFDLRDNQSNESEQQEGLLGFDTGLPSSEEYNKRMDEQFGNFGSF